jgi:hypothetical protein
MNSRIGKCGSYISPKKKISKIQHLEIEPQTELVGEEIG